MGRKFDDITGCRFGKLVAKKPMGKAKNGNYRWLCECDCGNYYLTTGVRLKNGRSASCGCDKTKKRPRKEINTTLCWNCQRSIPIHGVSCSWSAGFIPIQGWNAERRDLYISGSKSNTERTVESYLVKECPEFLAENRREII